MWKKIALIIGVVAGIAQIFQWIETSKWLRALPMISSSVLSGIFNLSLLALIAIGLWRISSLERRHSSDAGDLLGKIVSLETRVWEGLNKSLLQVRSPIEARLTEIEHRLAKVAPTLGDFAKQVLEEAPPAKGTESFPCVTASGTIQRFTRREIDELME